MDNADTNEKLLTLIMLLLDGHAVEVWGPHSKIAMDGDHNISFTYEAEGQTYFHEKKFTLGELYNLAGQLPDWTFKVGQ